MLLILMYHRVHGRGRVPDALGRHLRLLRRRHRFVLPGDTLPAGEVAICLSFDDATVDFYQAVYPLLRELGIGAVLAVPTAFIETDTDEPMAQRLIAQDRVAMGSDYAVAGSPLCTWKELREMHDSGLVHCASHSHNHVNLADPGVDLETELRLSARLLTDHLGYPPQTLVYPFGGTTPEVQRRVRRHYRYAMRIGSAANRDWNGAGGLLYRIDAEHFWPRGTTWSFADGLGYRLKYYGNRIRGK